jgi:hypothetical protein
VGSGVGEARSRVPEPLEPDRRHLGAIAGLAPLLAKGVAADREPDSR